MAEAVCDPQGRSTEPTSCGFFLFEMSKTWSPSNPPGTSWPSHVTGLPEGAFEFQERTTMLPYTITSPWFPAVESGAHSS